MGGAGERAWIISPILVEYANFCLHLSRFASLPYLHFTIQENLNMLQFYSCVGFPTLGVESMHMHFPLYENLLCWSMNIQIINLQPAYLKLFYVSSAARKHSWQLLHMLHHMVLHGVLFLPPTRSTLILLRINPGRPQCSEIF